MAVRAANLDEQDGFLSNSSELQSATLAAAAEIATFAKLRRQFLREVFE